MKRPIQIQRLDSGEKAWKQVGTVIHANVNKAKPGTSYLSSGSEQSKANKTFSIRYSRELSEIQFNMQSYRILCDGIVYEIMDYDDYMEKHIKIKMLGVSRGVRAD